MKFPIFSKSVTDKRIPSLLQVLIMSKSAISYLAFASLFSCLVFPCLAEQTGASDCYTRLDTWAKTMVHARSRLHELAAPADAKSFTSDVIRGKDKARQIEVDVSTYKHLWLVAGDGGDGIGCDHSSWCDPVLVDTQGGTLPLTQFKPVIATVGWNQLHINEDVDRKPIHVVDQEFKSGFFAHAESRLLFDLEAIEKETGRDFVKLRTWIGLATTCRGSGSCQFRVLPGLDRGSLVTPLWDLMQQDFPREAKAFSEATGRKVRDWLLADDPRSVEVQAVQRVLDDLKPYDKRLRAEFTGLTATGNAGDTSETRLAFFDRCVAARTAVEESDKAFDLAKRTLDLVEQLAPQTALRTEFNALQSEYAKARQQPETDAALIADLLTRCRTVRRAAILAHPALNFDTILITQCPPPGYSHMCDQYLGRHRRPGPGLVLLHNWKTKPETEILLKDKLPTGVAVHPDLSYDGKRVLFSYCDTTEPNREYRRFLVYEYDLETHSVRQVTGTSRDPMKGAEGRRTVLIEDFDPCYLPDGGFAFVSTRSQNFGRCHGSRYTPAYMVYRGELDGTGIRQLSFGEANEWEPSVLNDGRLIYTRWDYINRHDTIYQGLWAMHPDGTGTAHFFGSYTRNPCMTSETLAIPNSHRVVCTAMAHHSYTAGSVILIDPREGQDGDTPVTRLTPDIAFPETEGRPIGACISPYPVTEDLFLVAYTKDPLVFQGSVQRDGAYGIYLIDSLGGRELIYHDSEMSSYTPIPVRPRPVPPVLASAVAGLEHEDHGVLYVQNVRASTEELPHLGKLRVNRIYVQPTRSKPALSRANNEIIKGTLGTVNVDDDGSCAFSVPSGIPIQLQALDEKGMAVLTMRSFIYVQPGERLSCVGCHEHRLSAPPRAVGSTSVPLRPIQLPPGPQYEGGFSYARTVQPVLDRYCLSCHGLQRTAGKLDLTGTPDKGYCRSHNAFVEREGLVTIAYRNKETVSSKPGDYFAESGKLAVLLSKKHGGVKLPEEDFARIINWLDLNAQYYGDYSHNRPENRGPDPDGEKALRAAIAARFGEEIAKQPFYTLVNPALIEESRVLMAPLAKSAGGWGQWTQGAFKDRNDPEYATLCALVEKSLVPLQWHDHNGTCNRGSQCRCGCCWVEEAEKAYRSKVPQAMAEK